MKIVAAVKAMEAQCMALARASGQLNTVFTAPPASLRVARAEAFGKREVLAAVHERKVLGFVWVRPPRCGSDHASRLMYAEAQDPQVLRSLVQEAVRRSPHGFMAYHVPQGQQLGDTPTRLTAAGMRFGGYSYVGTEPATVLEISL